MELKFRSIKEIQETTSKLENDFWKEMFKMVDFEAKFQQYGYELDYNQISNDILDWLENYDPSFYNYFIHNK